METAIIILLAIICVAFIASPFLTKREEWKIVSFNKKLEKLKNEKEIFYQAIKDVDFECAEGKLTDKDHQELRDYYKEKAIQTVKQIETLKASLNEKTDSTLSQDA